MLNVGSIPLFTICYTVFDWLSSYLNYGKQLVCLGHSRFTTTTSCTIGLPQEQGSVCGPILFSLFFPIAQIATKPWSPSTTMHQWCPTLHYIVISLNNTFQLHDLEYCLFFLLSWFSHNGLYLNSEKTDPVLFGTYQYTTCLANISNISNCWFVSSTVWQSQTTRRQNRQLTLESHIVQMCPFMTLSQ